MRERVGGRLLWRQLRLPRARAAILRRWAARRACWRFLMALWSGFALGGFAPAGGVSMVTGGPPSVAIFVEAMSASGEAGALVCSDAAGVQPRCAGDEASFAGGGDLAR